jgi:hypothetical protein
MIATHITTIDMIFNQLVRLRDCDVHALTWMMSLTTLNWKA